MKKYNKSLADVTPYPVTKLSNADFKEGVDTGNFKQISVFDMIDESLMQTCHLTFDQLTKLFDTITDEETDLLLKEDKSFSEAKQVAILLKRFRL